MIKVTLKSPYNCDIFIEQHSNNVLAIKAPFQMLDEFRSMVGYRFCKETKRYLISDNPRNLTQIKLLKGENPFEIYDKPLIDQAPIRRKDKILPQQELMVKHAITRKSSLIAGDMGVGKTLGAIEFMEYCLMEGANTFWYCAPKSALNPGAGIPAEFRKWNCQVPVEFMTYERLKKIVTDPKLAEVINLPDVLILDEASMLKNNGSQRTQAVQGLVNQMRRIKGLNNVLILALSGTPAPKDPTDWWSLCEILCPGILRESSVQKLKQRLANIEMRNGINGKYPHLVSWKEEEVKLLYRRMAGLVLRIRAKDCLKLPPSEEINVYLKPSEELLRVARTISNSTDSAINKLQRLRQLSDGFQYKKVQSDSGYGEKQTYSNETIWAGSPKLEALEDILEEAGNRCVIYAGYTGAIDKLVEHCNQLKNQDNIRWSVIRIDGRGWLGLNAKGESVKYLTEEYFQAKDNDDNLINDEPIVIIAHPKSGGMSLNFTASNRLVRYSCDFDGQAHFQSGARIDRIGQTRPTKTINLIHLPTDELILNNLKLKKDLQALSLNDITTLLQTPIDRTEVR